MDITIIKHNINYGITKEGKVFSFNKNKFLSLGIKSNGYVICWLWSKNKVKVHHVHRLVCEHFLGDIRNKDINHKDGNKLNNNIDNLEIVTHKENMEHASKNNLMAKGSRCNRSSLTEKDIKVIRNSYIPYKVTYKMLGDKYGLCYQTIYDIIIRKTWKHVP